jgi:protein-S-isoprenylcysteine O-methyltransferase Ste14
VPAVYFVTGAPRFASYSFHPFVAWLGVVVLVSALMLFFHTHSRLGRYWSVTLEMRENHGLVTDGIYRFVRHPMYSAYFLWTLAQALLLPNWIAGPAGLVGFGTLFTFRVRREELMMLQNFGDTYAAYAARTKRIIPGVF